MDPYGQGPAGAFRDEKEWAVMRARQNPTFPATHRSMPPSLFYFSSPQMRRHRSSNGSREYMQPTGDFVHI